MVRWLRQFCSDIMAGRAAASARMRWAAFVGGIADGVVTCGLTVCKGLSWIGGAAHGLAIRIGILRPVRWPFGRARHSLELRAYWFTRIVREFLAFFVRTPLRAAMERRLESVVSEAVPGGVVVAMFHSPLDRLLQSWCRKREAAEIVTRRTCGVSELRRLVRLIRSGGRVVVFADAAPVTPGCVVSLFGERTEVSLFPARLAAAAGVPLMPALFVWTPASISLHLGQICRVQRGAGTVAAASREAIHFFEAELQRNPELWRGVRSEPSLRPPIGPLRPGSPFLP